MHRRHVYCGAEGAGAVEAGREAEAYEADVETFVTPMKEVDGQLVEVEGAKPSITIDPKQH